MNTRNLVEQKQNVTVHFLRLTGRYYPYYIDFYTSVLMYAAHISMKSIYKAELVEKMQP